MQSWHRVQEHFDGHSGEYHKRGFARSVALHQRKNSFLKRFVRYKPTQPLRVLDVGAGGGIWANLFLSEYPWAQLCCLDLSPAMLQRIPIRPGMHCVRANAIDLPFSDTCFDLINVDALMHHLIDYRGYSATLRQITRFLASLRSLLKPGGYIIIREIYHASLVREDIAGRLLFVLSTLRLPTVGQCLLKRVGIRSQGAGVCFLAPKQWAGLLRDTGYRIVGREDLPWRVKPLRRIAGIKSSGYLFLLVSPL